VDNDTSVLPLLPQLLLVSFATIPTNSSQGTCPVNIDECEAPTPSFAPADDKALTDPHPEGMKKGGKVVPINKQ
jgi:hypothetical protein